MFQRQHGSIFVLIVAEIEVEEPNKRGSSVHQGLAAQAGCQDVRWALRRERIWTDEEEGGWTGTKELQSLFAEDDIVTTLRENLEE
jgi:hypothetical protein